MKQIMSVIFVALFALSSCAQNAKELSNEKDSRYYQPLIAAEKDVIEGKGTEAPFSGVYNDFYADGLYVCKRCGAELYWSTDKFNSDCGWPSFDDEIPGAVSRIPDGMRTEITCTKCGAHLGHVFLNEGFTEKNTRHCVNSISLEFIPAHAEKGAKQDTAIFAGGCFWGVEYYLEQSPGVIRVEDGYIGGHIENPTYEDVCSNLSGYAEAVRVVFDPAQTDYETLARLFFEIHDPTQVDRQGPDIGDQYRSEIFYKNVVQKQTAEKLIDILEKKGYDVATRVSPASTFYRAEAYHQNYYERKGGTPYCHKYTKRF